MILSVSHRNIFRYGLAVSLARHALHLAPRATPAQTCHRHDYVLDPLPEVRTRCTDFFGNVVDFISFQTDHTVFAIESRSVVEITPPIPPVAALTPPWEQVRDSVAVDLAPDSLAAYEFSFDSPFTATDADLEALVVPSFQPGRPILEAARDLTARSYREFAY
ncbi:MAG: transglutaminase N-terminal domain-containing protein, partial [Alphaproteobacteria bacterium]